MRKYIFSENKVSKSDMINLSLESYHPDSDMNLGALKKKDARLVKKFQSYLLEQDELINMKGVRRPVVDTQAIDEQLLLDNTK